MENFLDVIREPWPWYVAGPLIGLVVPLLLVLGNKSFGISSSLRHICAACIPARIPFFQYEWRKETWNLVFVSGVLAGGIIAATVLKSPGPVQIHANLQSELNTVGITPSGGLLPEEIFSFDGLFTLRGFIMIVVGGFLVGFGTRYAGGCTSGHSIMGLSTLQPASLIATICFMVGGIIMANFILPIILTL